MTVETEVKTAETAVIAEAPKLVLSSPILAGVLAFIAWVLIMLAGWGVWHVLSAPQRARNAQEAAKVLTVQTQAQTGAGQAAAAIADTGAKRDIGTLQIKVQNASAIQALPSAHVVAAPVADADVWRQHLCLYDSARDDVQCGRLQPAHPAAVSHAGS